MPITFDDLPNEVLTKIIEDIPRGPDFCDLRLVSKRLKDITTPIIFSDFKVIINRSTARHSKILREMLVTKDLSVFGHIRNLEIMTIPSLPTDDPWFDTLEVLVPNFTNVFKLSWSHAGKSFSLAPEYFPDKDYPEGVIERLGQSFGALLHLKELYLELGFERQDPTPDIPLEYIAGLHVLDITWTDNYRPAARTLSHTSRLLARCSDIETFSFIVLYANNTFIMPRFGPSLRFEEVFDVTVSLPVDLRLKSVKTLGLVVNGNDWRRYIRHFRYLQRLTIGLDPSASAAAHIGEIFNVLAIERIHLREIQIDVLHHPGVFRYMSSYSGLEKIVIWPGHPLDDSSQLVDQFFSTVLPYHVGSLMFLTIGRNLATAWSRALSAEHLGKVIACTQLQHIKCWISITSEDVAAERADVLITWLETCLQLPRLRHLGCIPISLEGPHAIYKDRGPDLWVNELVKGVVKVFVKKNRILFTIDAKYNYGKDIY